MAGASLDRIETEELKALAAHLAHEGLWRAQDDEETVAEDEDEDDLDDEDDDEDADDEDVDDEDEDEDEDEEAETEEA